MIVVLFISYNFCDIRPLFSPFFSVICVLCFERNNLQLFGGFFSLFFFSDFFRALFLKNQSVNVHQIFKTHKSSSIHEINKFEVDNVTSRLICWRQGSFTGYVLHATPPKFIVIENETFRHWRWMAVDDPKYSC